MSTPPSTVAILLCTYQGERFLAEQLESIAMQDYSTWQIYASDDGSTDNTLNILTHYQQQWGRAKFHIRHGPGKGFVANFLTLLCAPDIQADYYAFADQDDTWYPDKLSRALKQLAPHTAPALYCGRTELMDETGTPLGFSRPFPKPPCFSNALVQSIAGGNTMVMNAAACALLRRAGPVTVASHDWWSYLVVSGCGGHVYYDPLPALRYRQHTSNLVGSQPKSWAAKWKRLRMVFKGRFRTWNDQHMQAIAPLHPLLTLENQQKLAFFSAARQRWLIPRLIGFYRCRIHRQNPFDNCALVAAAFFNRI